uniref:F-box associated beta-propeller type 1 domain-containing protein n=1 Tax=Oryza meridionalis TaxID=40149 RepID=A0A0E0DV33_9ORYZ
MDDVMSEILVRLPSKSVVRYRDVCRSWLRITSCPYFLAAHSPRRPNDMIVFTGSGELGTIPVSLDPPAFTPIHLHNKPLSFDRRKYINCKGTLAEMLVGSCDGLLVEQDHGLYVVCNPMTRQWTNLPPLLAEGAMPCGFYHHVPSGEYRLLCRAMDTGGCWAYYILAGPRRLCLCTEQPVIWGLGTPTAHGGSLYWLRLTFPGLPGTDKMLAFDTVAETSRELPRPPTGANLNVRLCDMGGKLCVTSAPHGTMSTRQRYTVDLWVADEDEDGGGRWTWTRRHRVCLQQRMLMHSSIWAARFVCVERDDVMVVCESAHDKKLNTQHAAGLYHLRDSKFLEPALDLGECSLSQFRFKESLVRHAFFDLPRSPDLNFIPFDLPPPQLSPFFHT